MIYSRKRSFISLPCHYYTFFLEVESVEEELFRFVCVFYYSHVLSYNYWEDTGYNIEGSLQCCSRHTNIRRRTGNGGIDSVYKLLEIVSFNGNR